MGMGHSFAKGCYWSWGSSQGRSSVLGCPSPDLNAAVWREVSENKGMPSTACHTMGTSTDWSKLMLPQPRCENRRDTSRRDLPPPRRQWVARDAVTAASCSPCHGHRTSLGWVTGRISNRGHTTCFSRPEEPLSVQAYSRNVVSMELWHLTWAVPEWSLWDPCCVGQWHDSLAALSEWSLWATVV